MIHPLYPIYESDTKFSFKRLLNPLNIYRFFKYSYQRFIRGFDDTATWSIDCTLAEQIPAMIKVMKDRTIGYPAEFSSIKEWHDICDKICVGFDSYIHTFEDWKYCPTEIADDPEKLLQWQKEKEESFKEGMRLFVEYFPRLWD